MNLLYRIIYNRYINFFLRWINRGLSPLLPDAIQLPPSGIIDIRNSGRPFRLATNQTSYLTQVIFWKGLDSFEYVPLFRKLIRKIHTFYDVGANIGLYSLLAARENPDVTIYSFEPARGASHYLDRNIRLNNLEHRIKAEKIALSDDAGSTEFHEIRNDKYRFTAHVLSGENNAATKQTERNYQSYRVDRLTLDTYSQKIPGHRPVDLIKIDTEGAEYQILKGARSLIESDRPIIICELLFNLNEERIEHLMRELGYDFYTYEAEQLIPRETLARSVDDGIRDCFFVHPSKEAIIRDYL